MEVILLAWSMMIKVNPCPCKGWLYCFEFCWKNYQHKCKISIIDSLRTKKVTTKVTNECFDKYVVFHNDLVERDEITEDQLTHVCRTSSKINVKIGGDELGKRTKCYQSKKQHSANESK